MRKRIFRCLILVSVIVMLLSSLISTAFLHSYFNREQAGELDIALELAADAVNALGVSYLDGVDDNVYRFTVIDPTGQVVYDTAADAETMENHADREEIRQALGSGSGSSARYSATLTEKTFYEAVRLRDGRVLRVSVSQLSLGGAFLRVLPMNLLIAVIAIGISLLLSSRMAKRITEPLLKLDLDNPAENDTYEELSPVLTKIRRQHAQIKGQMAQLQAKSNEFNQIISSMREGLVLLNEQGLVVAMNASARGIFGVRGDAVGRDFLTLDRSPALSRALDSVAAGAHAEVILSKNGREYQFTISRIESGGRVIGTLILGFDITEKAFAERNRQEFTANVSHELKTPLQSIIGLSEMLENGIVKAGDTAHFAGNIHAEAARLYSLIEDIIRLSQLDEKAEPAREPIDLQAVAAEVAEGLQPAAGKKRVCLTLDCDPVQIRGVRRYVYEILYNLCDNAIRYNREGGRVAIAVRERAGSAVITVSDTGIGIPAEHQARIFERFYRVDKSHSRETGGTGLGLSIVKRAVMLHNGKVELRSTPGEGTTVTVTLPQ